ncbi:MAG: adenosylcobinamide-GDP ribazoletransferase [Candidatus Atribacteria bacterium]|nr:adenosylcobinamide-GDP ribazoletransferase [Candidatus Atribacteria bacterium]
MKFILLVELRHPSYLLWAPLLGRVGALEVAALFPPLFEGEGLGKELLRKVPIAFFLFWVAVVAFLMGWQEGVLHLLKIGIHFGIIYTLGKVFQRHFGGLNGDMLGCIIELGEIIFLFWGRV